MIITLVLSAIIGIALCFWYFKVERTRRLNARIEVWFHRLEEELNVCAVNHHVTLVSNMWHDANLEGFYLLPPSYIDENLKIATDHWYYYNPMIQVFYIAANQTLVSTLHVPNFETMDLLTQAERDAKCEELQYRLTQNLVYKQSDVKEITISAIREKVIQLQKTILLSYGLDEKSVYY